MSGSAVLPPKRPPRSPLELQLPGTAVPEENAGGRPKLSLNPAPAAPQPTTSSGRPSLKLPGLTAGVAGLSLAIPQKVAGRYSKALDRANVDDDSENDLDSDDNDDGDGTGGHGLWAAGEQERMAGELLEVINGAPAGELEDELSGRTRRPRSNSRLLAKSGGAGGGTATSSSTTANGRETGAKGGEHALLSPPTVFSPAPPLPPITVASSTASPPPSSASSSPPRAASSSSSSSSNTAPLLNFYGDHVRAALQPTPSLHSIPLDSPPLQGGPAVSGPECSGPPNPSRGSPGVVTSWPQHAEADDAERIRNERPAPPPPAEDMEAGDEERHDGKLDISPQTIKDLGRLGEGASGEVRRVLHVPSGMVMAKKVSQPVSRPGGGFLPVTASLMVRRAGRPSRPRRTQKSTSSICANCSS